MGTTEEEILTACVGNIGQLITFVFHLLEFLLGISYFVGGTLVKWVVFIGTILLEGTIGTWDILKLTGAELWDFGAGLVKIGLLLYYGVILVIDSFVVIIMDLKSFSVHVVQSLGEQLNNAQAAVVNHTSRTFSTVPNTICLSLMFIGEMTTNFVFGMMTVIWDFLTQLVLAPVNVIRTMVLLLAQLLDIPFYVYDIFYDIPRSGKAGLVVIAVFCVIYWKVNFFAIPRLSLNLVKWVCREVLNFFKILRNYKRFYKHVLNYANGGTGQGNNRERETKALCVICQEASVQFISLPCKHVCLCHSCVKALVDIDNRCPLCRGAVTKFERVYIPL